MGGRYVAIFDLEERVGQAGQSRVRQYEGKKIRGGNGMGRNYMYGRRGERRQGNGVWYVIIG